MNAEIVPFGKYKGQPVEVLAADAEYCEWLTAQPWFKSRYLNVYNTIINYGTEPQDSPEHNEMQARFLDDDWCFRLADLLWPRRRGTYGIEVARKLLNGSPNYQMFSECCELEIHAAEIVPRRFEDHGWDVVYGIEPAGVTAHRTKLVPPLPACTCKCDHEAGCDTNATCRGGDGQYHLGGPYGACRHKYHKQEKRGIDSTDHPCGSDCYWAYGGPLTSDQRQWLREKNHYYAPSYGGLIRAELKPDLGDDYPAVLRQVTGYHSASHIDKRCVVARRYAFERVTWEQVRKIFAASQVTLLAESEIASPPPNPEDQALALIEDRLGGKPIPAP